jgi:hypothetical protein
MKEESSPPQDRAEEALNLPPSPARMGSPPAQPALQPRQWLSALKACSQGAERSLEIPLDGRRPYRALVSQPKSLSVRTLAWFPVRLSGPSLGLQVS